MFKYPNIELIEYTDNLTEKILCENYNINESAIILLDYIANTNIFEKNKSLLKINNYNYIGTNINYYFGYTDIIINNITKNNCNNLLCNILNKTETNIIWSDLIIKYYNQNFNYYSNKQITILNKLLDEIKMLFLKINEDIKLLNKKKYELDIINKSLYEYINQNLNNILENFFTKIHIFYILSICYNSNSNNNYKYILIYEKNLLDILKSYL